MNSTMTYKHPGGNESSAGKHRTQNYFHGSYNTETRVVNTQFMEGSVNNVIERCKSSKTYCWPCPSRLMVLTTDFCSPLLVDLEESCTGRVGEEGSASRPDPIELESAAALELVLFCFGLVEPWSFEALFLLVVAGAEDVDGDEYDPVAPALGMEMVGTGGRHLDVLPADVWEASTVVAFVCGSEFVLG